MPSPTMILNPVFPGPAAPSLCGPSATLCRCCPPTALPTHALRCRDRCVPPPAISLRLDSKCKASPAEVCPQVPHLERSEEDVAKSVLGYFLAPELAPAILAPPPFKVGPRMEFLAMGFVGGNQGPQEKTGSIREEGFVRSTGHTA